MLQWKHPIRQNWLHISIAYRELLVKKKLVWQDCRISTPFTLSEEPISKPLTDYFQSEIYGPSPTLFDCIATHHYSFVHPRKKLLQSNSLPKCVLQDGCVPESRFSSLAPSVKWFVGIFCLFFLTKATAESFVLFPVTQKEHFAADNVLLWHH